MKLSVMMITYNHEPFIAQALESILAQRVNFDYEIIVGEDCSTDRTREILMDFHNRYPARIEPLIRERNLGVMRNLEQTLAACRGEYVALIEGDDYWTCGSKLQKQVDFLDSHPEYSICCHRAHIIYQKDRENIRDKSDAAQPRLFPSRQAGTYRIEDLLAENFIMTCTAVYRNRTVGAVPSWFLNLQLGDWPLCALAARSGPIYLMDEIMAAYRVHSGGVWSSQTSRGRLRATTQMLKALDEHLDFKYHGIIQQSLVKLCLYAAANYRREGNRLETAHLLLSFVKNGGWHLQECRRELRALAEYVLLGSWHGMSITTQIVQLTLSKFGFTLVRVECATNRRQLKIRRISRGSK